MYYYENDLYRYKFHRLNDEHRRLLEFLMEKNPRLLGEYSYECTGAQVGDVVKKKSVFHSVKTGCRLMMSFLKVF